ncbi:MAG: Holliday junction branch migration protein RuvA [Acidimicrobiales bacterium]
MIGSLRGRLLDRGTADGAAAEVLVEVGGMGYRVTVAPTTAVALGDVGDEVFVWVHHHVREEAHTLYGFGGRDERITFGALLGAHGVGPSLALAILSVHDPLALARILAEDDVGALCLVPGVGKKTAARLLVELKSRLHVPETDPRVAVGLRHEPNANGAGAPHQPSVRSDVREALAGLGYSAEEIHGATAELSDDGDAPQLLRQALQRLASARQGLGG